MDTLTQEHDNVLKILKQTKIKELEGIQVDKILYIESYYAIEASKKYVSWFCAFKQFLKVFKEILIGINDISFNLKHKDILFLVTIYNRSDHDDYYKNFRNIFQESDSAVLYFPTKLKEKLKLISIKDILYKLRLYHRMKEYLSMIKNEIIKNKLGLLLMKATLLKQYIDNLEFYPKVVISFCDAFMFENLIVQALRKHGTISITNQHSQILFLGFDTEHIPQSQIFNFTSDYFLAKGEFAKKQFIKAGVADYRVKVVGSLDRKSKIYYVEKNTRLFGVFLNSLLLKDAMKINKNIITKAEVIAHKIGYKYVLKLHPADRIENYTDVTLINCETFCTPKSKLSDIFQKIEFGLFTMSGVYIDMITNGVKAYQINTNAEVCYPLVENDNDKIFSIDDFIQKFENWSKLSLDEKTQYLRSVVNDYVADTYAADNIKNFVNSLLIESDSNVPQTQTQNKSFYKLKDR